MQTDGARMLREEVTEVDIADIVSKWTGIPVRTLSHPPLCIQAPFSQILQSRDLLNECDAGNVVVHATFETSQDVDPRKGAAGLTPNSPIAQPMPNTLLN